jgi:hypothetical protein
MESKPHSDEQSSTPQIIFLLAGWSCSGKDTVGSILVRDHGFHRAAFADPLKDEVARHLGIPRDWCDTQEGKLTSVRGETVRSWLIKQGEGRRKADGVGCWAKALLDLSDSVLRTQSRVVITDWRHIEELIELQRSLPRAEIYPICVRRGSQRVSPVADKTEYSLLGFPFWRIIDNNGTLQDLAWSLVTLASSLPPTSSAQAGLEI